MEDFVEVFIKAIFIASFSKVYFFLAYFDGLGSSILFSPITQQKVFIILLFDLALHAFQWKFTILITLFDRIFLGFFNGKQLLKLFGSLNNLLLVTDCLIFLILDEFVGMLGAHLL